MKYAIWKVKKALRDARVFLKGRIRSFQKTITPEYLKNESYEHLPIPIRWESIAKGRELQVEIGSGHGEVLVANNKSQAIRVGYEIRTRFYKLAKGKIQKREDAYIFKGNAYESLFLHYKDYSIDKVFALFPDPWHKPKHAKRRPLNETFFRRLAQKLKKGGAIVVATDWPEYQVFVTEEAQKVKDLYHVVSKPYDHSEYGIPITHYHQKWIKRGRNFVAIELKKK